MRAPDKLSQPVLGTTPDYTWHNKLATVYEAKRTGDKFLPLPHGYNLAPGASARGGAYPRVTDIELGTPVNEPYDVKYGDQYGFSEPDKSGNGSRNSRLGYTRHKVQEVHNRMR